MPLSTQHLPSRNLYGRDTDVARLVGMLTPGSSLLVTVTGRGGVGKTALAGEVVRSLDDLERTAWVSLAGVTEPDLVLSEIATALGVHLEPGDDLTEAVLAMLDHGSPLLVLDNAEHLIAGAPVLGELLRRCPGVRVLVTSQAPLRLQDEQVVTLSPLPVPGDVAAMSLDDLAAQPAVAAYCQRARAVDQDFVLTEHTAAAIAELCRRLEGLPLAIELAAARAASLPATEILRRVGSDAGLGLLRRRRNDVPARHHGVIEAIDWTYRLLSSAERRALRRLSVAVGSFDADSAIGLLQDDSGGRADADALDELSALVDFHLIDPVRDADPPRFAMPDSIRSFARAELDRRGETGDLQRLRLRIRAQQARVVAAGTEPGTEERLGLRVEADRDDLLDAMRIAVSLGLADDALDIGRGLGEHWDLRGYGPVQRELLDGALELGERSGADPVRIANATLWSAYLELRHTSDVDHEVQRHRICRAEQVARDAGDDATLFHAQCVWLLVAPVTGDLEQAAAAAELGLQLAEQNSNEAWRAVISVWAGMLAGLCGDDDRAVQLGTEALTVARRNGDKETVVRASMLLGGLADRLPEGVPGMPSATEILELTRELGMAYYEAVAVVRMVEISIRLGDRDAATRWMAEALEVARTIPGSSTVGFHLLAVASTAHLCGDAHHAAFFFGTVRESYERLQLFVSATQRERHDSMVDETRAMLGEQEFEQQIELGALLNRGEAVDEAIRYIEQLRSPSVEEAAPAIDQDLAPLERLTARQLEVLRLLAAGLSNKDIAAELGVRAKTVMHHTTAIYRELGVRGRGEAAALAFRAQLVD
jgi:non-specific serine/threonine protein kinase